VERSRIRERFDGAMGSARFGRLRARLPRYAFLTLVGVFCLAGVRAVVAPPRASVAIPDGRAAVDHAVESFATEFVRAYLTYDARSPEAHEAALSPFVPSGLELGAGFTPPASGAQRVRWAEVAQVQRPLSGGVVLTVAAKVNTSSQPLYVSVPVRRGAGGAIYLSSYPSFVGPPLTSRPSVLESPREGVRDEDVSSLVKRALTNYLAGDAENLSADLAEAATVTLPPNRLSLTSVDDLLWTDGPESGAVLATVNAADPRGGQYTLRYELGIQRITEADPRISPGWRVTYVQAISQES
jgi:hypothetical protein